MLCEKCRKRIVSSGDVVYFDFICPCDLGLDDNNPIVWHDAPAYDDAPPYQVCLQKVERFR